MELDAMILVFWMLNFKPEFSLFSFTFNNRLFSYFSLSAIRVVSPAYMRLLIFLQAILIPASASSSPAFHIMHSAYKLKKRGDNIQPWHTPFPIFEPVCCSMSGSNSIQSAKTRLGVDCGSDHELLIAKFRLKLKKVGKTTRQFRYDLNQIPYDYTEEVRNRFKGLDLIECLMSYGRRFVTLYRRQGSRPAPWKRNAKEQNGCLRRAYK